MKNITCIITCFFMLLISKKAFTQTASNTEGDPYIWLEEIKNDRVDTWVEKQNKKTKERLTTDTRFLTIAQQFENMLSEGNSVPSLVDLTQNHGYIYQVHQNKDNPRGVFRRIKIDDFSNASKWENLIDIDKLAAKDERNWFLNSYQLTFSPSGTKMLIPLSDGGTDATIIKEYDLINKKFIKNGFNSFTVRRNTSQYLDENTLIIATALNGDEKTQSNYPNTIRRWQRGENLDDAKIIFTVSKNNIMAIPTVMATPSYRKILLVDVVNFGDIRFTALNENDEKVPLELPGDDISSISVGLSAISNHLLVKLNSEYKVDDKIFPPESLVAFDIPKMIANSGKATYDLVRLVYSFKDNQGINVFGGITVSEDAIYLSLLEDVKSKLLKLSLSESDNDSWVSKEIEFDGTGTISLMMNPDPYSSKILCSFENITKPLSLYSIDKSKPKKIASKKSYTDLSNFSTKQYFATSADGTKVPYFVTSNNNTKTSKNTPVLMYGYGGFGIPITQTYGYPYIGNMHELWLQNGGIFVVANPRGGGEYGAKWHLAAKDVNRFKVYEDLEAIALDLIKREITTPKKIGFIGGSNGGLTAGVLATKYPDLFGASISQVPLLDMKRFHKLLAGASWIHEYGNPEDPIQAQSLLSYSPYHNIRLGQEYPEIFFLTSTTDDRVHPGHARKMAAKMEDLGHPMLFFEAEQGGHAMAITNKGKAHNYALQLVYLLQKLQSK